MEYDELVTAIAMVDAAHDALDNTDEDICNVWRASLTVIRNQMNDERLTILGGKYTVEAAISS